MEPRERTQAVVAEKLGFVEHVVEDAAQPVGVDDREQPALALGVLDFE